MCEQDDEMKNLLGSPAMNVEPDPLRMQAVRERMMHMAGSPRHTNPVRRTALTIGLLLGVSAVGMAATQTGRDFVRWVFTSVKPDYVAATAAGWTASRSDRPFTAEEIGHMKAQHAEIDRIKEVGGGRLARLLEGPDPCGSSRQWTTLLVEYALSDGTTENVGQDVLSPKQKVSMRWDEISALRDAGAGELISAEPWPTGLGRYTIRFTLSDGQTVDLMTHYPPGTRQEREKIFAETRELKKQLRFVVEDPRGSESDRGVWGTLYYTLADGRKVGIVERVPKEALTPDGKQVAVPASEASKNGWQSISPDQQEAEALMEAGGGRLIGVYERPDPRNGSGRQWTVCKVEYTLASGETFLMNQGPPSGKQGANLRWDEISALRDAGAGQILSQEPSHAGLGKYTIRFTLSDGQTVDLQTQYPPGTRQEREKIFAETRELKKQLRFAVEEPQDLHGNTWALLRYTLADGRAVGIKEQVPKEALTPSGNQVAAPASEVP